MHSFVFVRHEHIYEKMKPHLLRTDDIVVDDLYALERLVGTKRVVLCTLSLLSNPILQDSGFFGLIPVERLIVDEASQLDVFEYMVSSRVVCQMYGT